MQLENRAGPPPGPRATATVVACVILLSLAALALRLYFLDRVRALDGFTWTDADHYMQQAQALASGRAALATRVVAAVRYSYLGFPFYLPPLYTFFLALFALVPAWYPLSAAVAQACLGALCVPLAWWTGRTLHSDRAGLAAAALFTIWVPSITSGGLFIQEQLFVPLLIAAFALLLGAGDGPGSAGRFLAAGIAFGLAALTRSMPMYFVPIVAGSVWMGQPRGFRHAAAFLAGFAAATVPYSVFLSVETGSLVFIENHGGLSLWKYGGNLQSLPTVGKAGAAAFGHLVSAPLAFLRTWADYARLLFKPHGGRWLEISVVAASAGEAAALKWVAHLGVDFLFALVAVLWPLGAVLARRRRAAVLLATWVAFGLTLTALAGTAGPRYRSPFEPHMMVLAGAVLAGGWRKPSARWFWPAASLSVALAVLVVTQLSTSARGQAEYGIRGWIHAAGERKARSAGSAGINVLPVDGKLQFAVRHTGEPAPASVEVQVEDHLVDRVMLESGGERSFRIAWSRVIPGFVTIETRDRASGRPAPCEIRVVTPVPRRTE